MIKQLRTLKIVTCILLLTFLSACSHKTTDDSDITQNISPTMTIAATITPADVSQMETAQIVDVKVLPDQSYKDFFTENPYSQISKYMIHVYQPDKDLYNYLFKAVVKRDKTVDISSFDLTPKQIIGTASALYEQAGLQLFYLYRVKWSDDYKTIKLIYTEDSSEDIKKYQDVFYAQMNHLLYNVAPKTDSPLQKFFSEYDYITRYADYTDEMNDPTTFTAGSLLVNQKSICGGFSLLADYVLNFIGVPSVYISNEPHAWVIVTLNGSRYHADFTWGAGSANSNISFLHNALMNDQTRMDGLNSAGFGDYKIIEGYPGDKEVEPETCTDNRYDFLKDIYDDYTLDIDNEWIYYSDNDGIYRIHFDGTGKESLLQQFGYPIDLFQGTLYFVSGDQVLYQMKPGESPISLDQKVNTNMRIEDGVLKYSVGDDTQTMRKIDLNAFSPDDFEMDRSIHLEPYQISRQQTFQLSITFSKIMDTSKLPEDLIALVDQDGNNLPLNMVWDNNGKELNIRSKEYINHLDGVSLYIRAGIEDINGNKTKKSYDKGIKFTE